MAKILILEKKRGNSFVFCSLNRNFARRNLITNSNLYVYEENFYAYFRSILCYEY